jgi:hypothetical protein
MGLESEGPTRPRYARRATRDEWIEKLEILSSSLPNEVDETWRWVMHGLDLNADYYLAIVEAIQQGRWRNAKDPRAYVKTVAKREALKMGLLETNSSNLVLISSLMPEEETIASEGEMLDTLLYRTESDEALKGEDGVWRQASGESDDSGEEWRFEFETFWHYRMSKLPDDLKETIPPSEGMLRFVESFNAVTPDISVGAHDTIRVNWELWAKMAGFDEWEQKALLYSLAPQITGEKALADQPNETARKALQAAWKRLQRTGAQRLKRVVKIKSS